MSNLLPLQEKKSILRMYRKRLVALALAALALLGIVGVIMLVPSYRSLLAQNAALRETGIVAQAGEAGTTAAALAGTVDAINRQLGAFSDAEAASPLVAGLIAPMLSVKGPAVHITSFGYTPGAKPATADVTVSGTADSRADLLAFSDKIKALGTFTNVSVPIGSFIQDSNVAFTLSATAALAQ